MFPVGIEATRAALQPDERALGEIPCAARILRHERAEYVRDPVVGVLQIQYGVKLEILANDRRQTKAFHACCDLADAAGGRKFHHTERPD